MNTRLLLLLVVACMLVVGNAVAPSATSLAKEKKVTWQSPVKGATVSGLITLHVSVPDHTRELIFSVNGTLLYKDTTPPWSATLDTTVRPNGKYSLRAIARDNKKVLDDKTITVTVSNKPTPTPNPTPNPTPTSPPVADPVIMAAGDIACGAMSGGASCKQQLTSDVIVAENPQGVLLLGDNQYECGDLSDFNTFYTPTWGRFKAITYPAVGNHEYLVYDATHTYCTQTVGGEGYFSYFGAAAGDPKKGYYSFDIGAWHIIALNSVCSKAGGCSAGSPQEQWLRADLAAHPNSCVLAYWHHPRYSSGRQGSTVALDAFWNALYDYNAEIVLSGHDHNYERFAPQAANGTNLDGIADPTRGIRQFVVGTGGRNRTSLGALRANSEVFDSTSFGVLKLTLRASSYDWQFVPAVGSVFTDSGTGSCH